MTDAPERIWVKRYPDIGGPITVTFNPENVPSEAEYVRADRDLRAAIERLIDEDDDGVVSVQALRRVLDTEGERK